MNTAVLDLANFSTTVIDLPSGNSTLLLKVLIGICPQDDVEVIAAGGHECVCWLPVNLKIQRVIFGSISDFFLDCKSVIYGT